MWKLQPPLFLNRNLTYANYKKCRPKKPKRRTSARMSTLLTAVDKLVEQKCGTKHFMTLTFSGFHCDEIINERYAEVQIFHKETKTKVSFMRCAVKWGNLFRTKYFCCVVFEIIKIVLVHFLTKNLFSFSLRLKTEQLASIIIDINPNDMLKGLSVISLATEALKITSTDGKLLKVASCVLLFKVKIIERTPQNGYVCRKAETSFENFVFESELELFDDDREALIPSGEQKLNFTYNCNNTNISTLSKQAMWKLKHFMKKTLSLSALRDGQIDENYVKPAKLIFHLQWSRDLCLEVENNEKLANIIAAAAKRRVFTRSLSTGSLTRRSFATASRSSDHFQCLVYQFVHKNYRQKTEFWDRLKCPWCSLKTINMYILLKHLTLCHDRFKFKYVPSTSEARIDVFVNKCSENIRNDPFSRYGTKYRGEEPHKRKSMTSLLVYRPERNRPKLSEFIGCYDMMPNGRKRKFYHSITGIPQRPSANEFDSEDESDPIWLRQNTIRMIDEFIDVNAGEKVIMKLWNLHVLKMAYISEAQMPSAVISFVERNGHEILKQKLYRNCIVHLTNLFDHGLISSSICFQAIQNLQELLVKDATLCGVMYECIVQQREHAKSNRITVQNGKRLPFKAKRPTIQTTSIKKRLRSHSLGERIQQNKTKRPTLPQNTSPIILLTPRAVRKTVKRISK